MKSLLFLFLSFSAMAQTPIIFDQVETNGSGCLPGTTSTTLASDGQSMSLIFDQFSVQVPNHDEPTPVEPSPTRGSRYRPPRHSHSIFKSHKTCNISFVTNIPAGHRATAINIIVQARGNTMIDKGIRAYFSTILVGHRGLANSYGPIAKVVEKKMWTGRAEFFDEWITDTNVSVPLNSSCATASNKSIKFELKNHLEANILNMDETKEGLVTVDSNDARGMLTFTVSTAPCW